MCDSVRLLFFLFFFFLRGVQHGRVLSSSLFVLEALSIYGLSSTGVLLLLLLVDTTLRNQAQEILCHVQHRAAEVRVATRVVQHGALVGTIVFPTRQSAHRGIVVVARARPAIRLALSVVHRYLRVFGCLRPSVACRPAATLVGGTSVGVVPRLVRSRLFTLVE